MKKYICLIITHGNLAAELNELAQTFLPLEIPVYLYTNKKDSIETIVADASKKIKKERPAGIIIFIDLVGGSCWQPISTG